MSSAFGESNKSVEGKEDEGEGDEGEHDRPSRQSPSAGQLVAGRELPGGPPADVTAVKNEGRRGDAVTGPARERAVCGEDF